MDGDYQNQATFNALREQLQDAQRPAHYLAIPPVLFETVVERLNQSNCGQGARIIVEKPFGHDLASVYTKRVFKRLGILDASFHTLRHTAASWMVQQGVDLYAVGQILGHKTPRMTQRYAHLSPDYMAGAVGKLDGIMGGMLAAPLA